MKYISTVEKAIKEINFLQEFVLLAKDYQDITLEQRIIKLYAYEGSINEVTKIINTELSKNGEQIIDSVFVSNVIQSKPMDSLHKILRMNYMNKTKHIRKKSSKKISY
ncbi:hypothetical protein SAMN04487975_1133 [Planococcus glaciei]|uniref:hypothetical protein n=1 Tax=Planococcus glaciei TaxID=459472 RepID=UPI0008922F8F|nr:hypothetical protein [Planococcus glaciei]SDI19936.1 hypothetical protein SAMN04487975_1133 [Planococcus glaciei]